MESAGKMSFVSCNMLLHVNHSYDAFIWEAQLRSAATARHGNMNPALTYIVSTEGPWALQRAATVQVQAAAHPATKVHCFKWAAAQLCAGLDLLAELRDILLHTHVLRVCSFFNYQPRTEQQQGLSSNILNLHTFEFRAAAYSLDRKVAVKAFTLAKRKMDVRRLGLCRQHGAVPVASLLSVVGKSRCNRMTMPNMCTYVMCTTRGKQ